MLVCPLGGLQDKVFTAPRPRQLRCLRDVVPIHAHEAVLREKRRGGSTWQGEGRQGARAGRTPATVPWGEVR